MVLMPEFWINYSKNDTHDQFSDKIVREDIYISISSQENSYHNISCCSYTGRNFNVFYDDIITTVKTRTQHLTNKNFLGLEWIIRPTDKPKNLPELLIEKGYEQIRSDCKLGIDLQTFEQEIPLKDFKFDIKQVELAQVLEEPILNLLVENFPSLFNDLDDASRKYNSSVQMEENKGNIKEYFIVYNKSGQPIAFASLILRKDVQNTAFLSGAVTNKDYRRKGIYKALINTRIQRCRKLGISHIIVDAKKSTSAPILKKYGFRVIDDYDTYRLKFNNDIET